VFNIIRCIESTPSKIFTLPTAQRPALAADKGRA
jgi:hypothetical protein